MSRKTIQGIRLACLILTPLLFISNSIFFYLWMQKETFDCSSCAGTVEVRHDTIWPADTELKPIIAKVPEAVKAIKKPRPAAVAKVQGVKHVESVVNSAGASTPPLIAEGSCDSIFYYSDTTLVRQPDSCAIVVNDTLMDNRIIGRSVWHVNLRPEVHTTITKTLKEKWRFYVGANGTFNPNHIERWGVGPTAMVTIPKVGAINYYYDVHNNSHSAGFYALIKLKK